MAKEAFTFEPEHDGTLPLRTAVFQALGAASACWDTLEGAGVFDSERAITIGERLLEEIERHHAQEVR